MAFFVFCHPINVIQRWWPALCLNALIKLTPLMESLFIKDFRLNPNSLHTFYLLKKIRGFIGIECFRIKKNIENLNIKT